LYRVFGPMELSAVERYTTRPESLTDILFLNYKGDPISERGIRKLVVKYRKNGDYSILTGFWCGSRGAFVV
jgi:site-specific recombinase XerD